jgi:hypothetical protein
MAYVSQELKAKIAPAVKALLKRYGLKGSLSVRHHSTLVLTLRSGQIDFIDNFNRTCETVARPAHLPFQAATRSIQVNPYWCHEHFSGAAREFLVQAVSDLKGPDFFDHSDIQTDYFHLSHYVDINIGTWDRPYTVTV